MPNNLRGFNSMLLTLCAAMLVTGCPNNQSSTPEAPTGPAQSTSAPEQFPNSTVMSHVRVSGDPADLKLFNDKLNQFEGVTKLEDAFIACKACAELGGATPPPMLDYHYASEHLSKPQKFLDAWRSVKVAGKKVSLLLDDDLTAQPNAACPPSPPAPLCFSAPWCTSTDGCDKNRSAAGCQKCQ